MSRSRKSVTMDYNHHRKAGNEGDCPKHPALLAALDTILSHHAHTSFQYLDSFAGHPWHLLLDEGRFRTNRKSRSGKKELEYCTKSCGQNTRRRRPSTCYCGAIGIYPDDLHSCAGDGAVTTINRASSVTALVGYRRPVGICPEAGSTKSRN